MTDRFDAQLRQHLLGAANEQPADGQLAAIMDVVGATRQRPRLAARLTWAPDRMGPFPSVALRYGFVAAALIGALVAVMVFGAGGRGGGTVFSGTWTATDPGDGSTLTLRVGAGATPAVRFEDDFASGAACVGDAVKVFRADGTGEMSGDRLVATFPDGGGCGLVTVAVAGIYDYHQQSDTLSDQDGVVWVRVPADQMPDPQTRESDDPGTLAPTPIPSPSDAPETPDTPLCIDLADGGTYTAPVNFMSVTATVPGTPAIPWHGMRDYFHLADSCKNPAPIAFFASTATVVLDDACMPDTGEITTFEEAIARLDTPAGDDISKRIDLTIDGHAAARYDVSNLSTCEGFGLWAGTILGEGETGSIYVIDVDGVLVAIELNRNGNQTRAELDEAHAIVASLQFANGDATD